MRQRVVRSDRRRIGTRRWRRNRIAAGRQRGQRIHQRLHRRHKLRARKGAQRSVQRVQSRNVLANAFIIREEEELVAHDGPGNVATELIQPQRVLVRRLVEVVASI